jgi:hypothetical protein
MGGAYVSRKPLTMGVVAAWMLLAVLVAGAILAVSVSTAHAAPPMTVLTSCEGSGCHPTYRYAHPDGEPCANCHVPDRGYGPAHGDDYGEDCIGCHGSSYHYYGVAIPGSCLDCHNPQPHTAANTATAHASEGCNGCHGGSLTTTHAFLPEGSNQCDTCHASTDPSVANAIATGATGCVACHGSTPAGHAAGHEEIEVDGCSECHSFAGNSFFANHAAVDCLDCHSSPTAINSALNYSCGTCHTPSSTPLSLALGMFGGVALLMTPIVRRRFT